MLTIGDKNVFIRDKHVYKEINMFKLAIYMFTSEINMFSRANNE